MHRIEAPADDVLEDGGDLADEVVEDPVGRGRDGDPFDAEGERHDLGRVEPGDGSPGIAEKPVSRGSCPIISAETDADLGVAGLTHYR